MVAKGISENKHVDINERFAVKKASFGDMPSEFFPDFYGSDKIH